MEENELEKITFDQLAKEWLQYKKATIKESSYLNYKFLLSTRLQEIGDKTIKELLHYDFNKFVEKLMSDLANKTVKDIMTVLKSILRYAEIKYEVNFKISLISTPSQIQKEVEVFSEKDRKKLENYCIESKELKDVGIMISLYTGLRIGEICALKWKNIDLDNKCIRVTNTLQRVYEDKKSTKILYETPKTQKSIRTIPIAKILYNKLKSLAKYYTEDDFILTGEKEKFVEPLGYRYTYRQVLKNCNIQYKKYHILRHTFATRCMKVGMDVKSLSEILGHANVSITLNIYVHSSFETKNKFINKL